MSFRRGQLDVYIPVLAVLACITLPLSLADTFQTWRDIAAAKPVPARVTDINDRPPYAAKKDRYGMEYPAVQYVDHEGFTRHLAPYSGALPGYFHVGQDVSVGRIWWAWLWRSWLVWEKAVAATAETEARPESIFRERDMHNHLLKGIAWCSSCGRALVPNDSGKKSTSGVKYRYYTCSLVMRETAAAPCPVGRLSADALEKATIALIAEASRHPTVIAEMIAASRSIRRGDRAGLRVEINRLNGELTEVDKKLTNCADAVAKGGAAVLGEALARRAAEFRQERQQVLVLLERKRQELALCDAGVLEEKRITENLEKLGQTLPNLPAAEQKELIRLFIERVEVSRYEPPSKAKKAAESVAEPAGRVMQLRLKLHLPELVQGMQERAEGGRTSVSVRGLSLDGRVDFTHAQQGEFSIVTPFRQTVRLDARVRTVPVPKAAPTHPILRAQRWQRMLDEKQVPHRFALAKRVGCTPGAVTKMLKLIKLLPEIQEYLAALKGQKEIWHFSAKRMSALSTLEAEMQRSAFERICRDFAERIADQPATGKQIAMPSQATMARKSLGRGLSAG